MDDIHSDHEINHPSGHPEAKEVKSEESIHTDEPVSFSPVVQELFHVITASSTSDIHETHYAVSRTVSTLAVLYEKARNAVEFRAEHLVRRAAIERIVKRLMVLNGGSKNIADNLILELLWARYIDSALVNEDKVKEIQQIIDRYTYIKKSLYGLNTKYQGIGWDKIIGLASAEIDESIVSPAKRQALNDFCYQAMRSKIQIPAMDEALVNMLTYIAVERTYAQADDALITCHLIKLVQPEWFHASVETVPQLQEAFFNNCHMISDGLKNPIVLSISRYVRKRIPPFLLIRDYCFETNEKAQKIAENTNQFHEELTKIASKRYKEIGAKVRRAVVRSIIYIFLTKMLFALALEAPFDIFIAKRIAYFSLAINTIFPPILLYLVAGFIAIPGDENTKSMVGVIHKIIYHFDQYAHENDPYVIKKKSNKPILTAVFSILYFVTFLVSFGLINWLLNIMDFSIASKLIFVFFVTLVSFFAYRIRQSAKEYEIVEKQGLLEPFIDFFFLPILRAGHWLSGEIAKLNIFMFIFDFILEAPLKVIFEVVEEWIRFIRTKKEEII